MTLMKQCFSCETKKPAEEFTKHSKSKDGLFYHCRECSQAYRKARRVKKGLRSYSQCAAKKRCSKCNQVKAGVQFLREAEAGDGLGRWCKVCHREYSKALYVYDPSVQAAASKEYTERMKLTYEDRMQEDIVPATKVCSTCGKRKRREGFYTARYRKSGLYSRCKVCNRAYQREYYKRRRAVST